MSRVAALIRLQDEATRHPKRLIMRPLGISHSGPQGVRDRVERLSRVEGRFSDRVPPGARDAKLDRRSPPRYPLLLRS